MRLFDLIREDFLANSHAKSRFVLVFFRTANWSLNSGAVVRTLCIPLRIAYRVVVDWVMGIDIPCSTRIGRRAVLYHSHALVINEAAIIGDDCILRHCVTIGNKITASGETGAPIVGNGVEFGAGAVVIGPITIGDNSKIGALSVVTRSVSAGSIMIGNPARAIERPDPSPHSEPTRGATS